VLEQAARLYGPAGIDGVAAFDHLADDSSRIDHKGVAIGEAEERKEDVVLAGSGLLFVTEDGEGDAEGGRKSFVLLATVHADADDLRSGRFESGDISLIRLELARSAARESLDVEGEDDGFLTTKVGETNGRAVLVGQGEVGSRVANFQ